MFENFGDMVTLDHVDASSEDIRSFAGDKHLLVIFDLATGCWGAYPVQTKGADEALLGAGAARSRGAPAPMTSRASTPTARLPL